MLIRVTEKCNGECSHCLVDAGPDRPEMNQDTWDATLEFIRMAAPNVVLFSGGEPTLHPKWYEWLRQLLDCGQAVVLASNGSFILDDEKFGRVTALEIKYGERFFVQVTADPAYYPHAKEILAHHRIQWVRVQTLDPTEIKPVGRAKISHPKTLLTKRTTSCANLYLMARQVHGGLREVVAGMERAGRYCSPCVSAAGDVKPGEFGCCRPVGSVFDFTGIVRELRSGELCDVCGLVKNLPVSARAILSGLSLPPPVDLALPR